MRQILCSGPRRLWNNLDTATCWNLDIAGSVYNLLTCHSCTTLCKCQKEFHENTDAYVTLCFYDKKMNLTSVVPDVHLNFQFLHSHVSFFNVAEVQPVTGVVNSCELGNFSCCVDSCIGMGMIVCDLSSNMY